jgi:hypothetical protein
MVTTRAAANKPNGIDNHIACLKNARFTVSAVRMHALSAVTKM